MWHLRPVRMGALLTPDRQRKLGAFAIVLAAHIGVFALVAQIQSQLLAHQYEGLIKKAKLRGRGGQNRGKGVTAPARR